MRSKQWTNDWTTLIYAISSHCPPAECAIVAHQPARLAAWRSPPDRHGL